MSTNPTEIDENSLAVPQSVSQRFICAESVTSPGGLLQLNVPEASSSHYEEHRLIVCCEIIVEVWRRA